MQPIIVHLHLFSHFFNKLINYLIIMFLGSKVHPVRRADNLTAICEPIVLDNMGSLTSHNPIGLHGLLRG
jgi:hypothetical protein